MSLEGYLPVKHASPCGYVYAIADGVQVHSQIAGNVDAQSWAGVWGSGCRVPIPDIRIHQSLEDDVSADAVVTRDPRVNVPAQDWIANPTLVSEVLSPLTKRHDRRVVQIIGASVRLLLRIAA